MSNSVYITKIAKFFPNEGVSNDDMETYLGKVNNTPSRAKRIILSKNGIKNRYYALDKDSNATHTNTEMAANSVKRLFEDGEYSIDDIDLLSCGTAYPEQIMPSHGVMVHGELGCKKNCEVVSFAGSCCTGMQALKYAYMEVKLGESKLAVASASERLSAIMRAKFFEKEAELLSKIDDRPMLAFEKEFLRWMLSDGAFAVLLQDKPNDKSLSLKIDWIEITSYANEIETCMYAGGEKSADGKLHGWTTFPEEEWLTKSLFSLKQDTRILGENIVKLGGRYMIDMSKKHGFKPEDIDWYMPHLSSMFFKQQILDEFKKLDFYIPEEKWFINLPKVGNIASASAFAMLEEALYNGMLKKGQKILMMIPESARFSYCYCMLTVC